MNQKLVSTGVDFSKFRKANIFKLPNQSIDYFVLENQIRILNSHLMDEKFLLY